MRSNVVASLFSAILVFCSPLYSGGQVRRSAPYDFFDGCNSRSTLLEGTSVVESNPFNGELNVDVSSTAFAGMGFGRAGAGIVYNPDFTGTVTIRASVRVKPPSTDVLYLTDLSLQNVNLLGKTSLSSQVFISATGGSTGDLLATTQFRNMEFGSFAANDLFSNPFVIENPFHFDEHIYNPAEVFAVTATTNVVQGRPLRICGGLQARANTAGFVPILGAYTTARYYAELLQISVTPLGYSPAPPPPPIKAPAPPPVQVPAYIKPSIFVIKKNDTGVGTMEAHVLSGPDVFRRFALNTGTAQHATQDQHVFRVADWDRDGQPDIFAIKKNATGTGSTEVHILSGAGSYQRYTLNTGTPQHETWYEYDFQVADWNRDGHQDLVIIKKYNTGTRSTEVHILSGASDFQEYILHTGTPQEETGGNYDFDIGDRDRDGVPDLFIIKKSGTGTGMVEIHVLSGASSFQRFILNTGTAQHPTGDEYVFRVADWDGDGFDDLFGIKKKQTGTGSTEVHVLSGASGFRQFVLQTGTVQSETIGDYDFDIARVKTFDVPAPIGNPIGREGQAPSFTATASIIAPPVTVNQWVPVYAAVANAGGALTGAITDVEIFDAGGRQVWQKAVENQTFAAGESKSYSFSWRPEAAGTYHVKIGVFAAGWSPLLFWKDQAATIYVDDGSASPPPPAPAQELQVWWPDNNAHLSGTQPFKAMLTGYAIENYRTHWQVDGGTLNEMGNSYVDHPHKESVVDLTGWTWRGAGPYQIRFVATNPAGSVLAERSVSIYVVH